VGQSQTVSFTATVTPAAAGTSVTNTASVASQSAGGFPTLDDSYPANNSASAVLTVSPRSDLSLTKAISDPNPSVGEIVTYTLTTANAGPTAATGVTISDPIPGGLAFVSASAGCSNVSGTLSCPVGELASGGQATVTFTAWVLNGAAATTVSNQATVSGDQPDPTPANNHAAVDATVPALVNLRVTKVPSTPHPPAGGEVTYTVTAANDGPSNASGVILTDPLPSGLSYVSATAGQGSCGELGGTVSCALGSIPAGGAALITITARVASAAQGKTITNIAAVSAAQHDDSPGLSSAQASITPQPPSAQPTARLTITKTVNRRRATFGTKLTYTIRVTNAGPATAVTPTVTDTFSGAATITAVHPSTGRCRRRNPLTCILASIPTGKRATLTVVARPGALGTLHNTAAVTTRTSLARGSRTIARATTTIQPGPHSHLVLHDTATPRTIPAGGTATFWPKITNPNPWPLHTVRVCDRLPHHVIFLGASAGARRAGQLVCWTIATLPAHKSRTLRMAIEPRARVAGTLRDAATATATAQGRHLTAHARAQVLVISSNMCGSTITLPRARATHNPIAVTAC
jgi:uncharacterized repeat protein (TIGR01451 family)